MPTKAVAIDSTFAPTNRLFAPDNKRVAFSVYILRGSTLVVYVTDDPTIRNYVANFAGGETVFFSVRDGHDTTKSWFARATSGSGTVYVHEEILSHSRMKQLGIESALELMK